MRARINSLVLAAKVFLLLAGRPTEVVSSSWPGRDYVGPTWIRLRDLVLWRHFLPCNDEATEEEKIGTKEPTRLCPYKYTDGQKSHQKEQWFIAQRVESTKEASMHSWLVKQDFRTQLAQKSGPVRLREHEHEPMADRSLWLVARNTDGHERITGQLQANYSPFQVKDVLWCLGSLRLGTGESW